MFTQHSAHTTDSTQHFPALRVGVDVGGTNTDAVILGGRELLAAAKRPTTEDVTTGIVDALADVIAMAGVRAERIGRVMVGTTHFTNAVVQGKGLLRTAVVRLGLPATAILPPFIDWPDDLRATVGGIGLLLPGGHEFYGRAISALDPAALRDAADTLRREGVETIAVTAVFSPVTDAHERAVASLLADALPGVRVVCSADIGRIGLLERENAAALNAALLGLAETTVDAFVQVIQSIQPGARLYLTQNDGTLMAADVARRFPVRTIASGPTNSMRGAAYLSGVADAIVLDIGGTTTDAGTLVQGFPRAAGFAVAVGGVRTNFHMPDLLSVGLGGGSIVADDGGAVGPQSVGARLREAARVFGGGTTTATDVAVALGRASVGVPPNISPEILSRAGAVIDMTIADVIDRMKTGTGAADVVLVGGGAILVGGAPIADVGALIRPPHHDVANAIGAALAQVSGEVERVVPVVAGERQRQIDAAVAEARSLALAAGADQATLATVAVDEVPLAYLPGNATRLHVKVVGELL